LQASLLARLDRLAPVREVAQIGAALGRQFSHQLIAGVASMPLPRLEEALAQLVGAEVIYRRGTPPNAEYTLSGIVAARCGGGGGASAVPFILAGYGAVVQLARRLVHSVRAQIVVATRQ
jgi:hypothetical protein